MGAIVTFEGIDEALGNLHYNKRALKYKLISTIRDQYRIGVDVASVREIDTDFLVKSLWDTGDDPTIIRNRRKNFNSIKSTVNYDLKKLYEEGKNSEGIVINQKNIFDMSDEAKSEMLESFSFSEDGDSQVPIGKIADVLNVVNDFISNKETQLEDDEKYEQLKEIIKEISGKVGIAGGTSGNAPEGGQQYKDDEGGIGTLSKADTSSNKNNIVSGTGGESRQDIKGGYKDSRVEEQEEGMEKASGGSGDENYGGYKEDPFIDVEDVYEKEPEDNYEEAEAEDAPDDIEKILEEDDAEELDDEELEEIEEGPEEDLEEVPEDEIEEETVDDPEDDYEEVEDEDGSDDIDEDLEEDDFEEVEVEDAADDEIEEIIEEDNVEEFDDEDIEEVDELPDDELEDIHGDEIEEEFIDDLEDDEFEEVEAENGSDDIEEILEEDDVEDLDEVADVDGAEEFDDTDIDGLEEVPEEYLEELPEDEIEEETGDDPDDDYEEIDDAPDDIEEIPEGEIEEELVDDLEGDEFEEVEGIGEGDQGSGGAAGGGGVREPGDAVIDEIEEIPEEDLEEIPEEEIEEELVDDFEDDDYEIAETEDAPDYIEEIFEEDDIEELEEVPEEDLEELPEEETEEETLNDLTAYDDLDDQDQSVHGIEEKKDIQDDYTLEKILDDYDESGYISEESRSRALLLADKFDKMLSETKRYYNQYILIPGGKYLTGHAAPNSNEKKQSHIELADFYFAKFPVTNHLFELFVEKTGYVTTAERKGYGIVYKGRYHSTIDEDSGRKTLEWSPSLESEKVKGACWFRPCGPGSSIHGKRNHPVVQVTLEDAMAFAAWTGKRLPTEQEWEAASRTSGGLDYPWGKSLEEGLCNIESSAVGDTTPVDQFHKAANKYGVYDLLGNVLEWTSSSELSSNKKIYIARGGSWVSGENIRLTQRFPLEAKTRSNILGFRCIAYR